MTASAANAKYAEALAHDIAAALDAAPHPGAVAVRYDRAAETWAVRITVARRRFDLIMPAAGAMYGLFRNGTWLGGMNLNTDAAPVDVAIARLRRIETKI